MIPEPVSHIPFAFALFFHTWVVRSRSLGPLFRRILKSSVLATDMGVHDTFMKQFEEILHGTTESSNGIVQWQTTKCSRQVFICQLLLKNADISNPVCSFLHLALRRLLTSEIFFFSLISVGRSWFLNSGHPRSNKNGHANINLRISWRSGTVLTPQMSPSQKRIPRCFSHGKWRSLWLI